MTKLTADGWSVRRGKLIRDNKRRSATEKYNTKSIKFLY